MIFPYLIPALAVIPLLRNASSWAFLWQVKEYRFDRFFDFIKTPEGRRAVFGMFHMYERALIIFGVILFFVDPSWVPYSISIGLAVESIAAFYSFLTHRVNRPQFTLRMLVTLLLLIISQIAVIFSSILFFPVLFPIIIVAVVLVTCPLIGLAIILTSPLTIFLRRRIIHRAIKLRPKFGSARFIGVTGSYGKSSIKKFLHTALSEKYRVEMTPKNINNEISVSRFLLSLVGRHFDYFIAEMGAYKKGEVRLLGKIIQQDIGIITGINEQHLSLFGGIYNTIAAKSEIAEQLAKRNGTLYINLDCPRARLAPAAKNVKVVTYGVRSEDVDARGEILALAHDVIKFRFRYGKINHDFTTPLIGKHSVLNLTGVIAVAFDLDLSPQEIQAGLDKMKNPSGTMRTIRYGESYLINDTYNSNPDGVVAGCSSLESFDKSLERAIVLDDILELGVKSEDIHREIGRELSRFGFSRIFLVGRNYASVVISGLLETGYHSENIIYSDERLSPELKRIADGQSVILFEGRQSGKYLKYLIGER